MPKFQMTNAERKNGVFLLEQYMEAITMQIDQLLPNLEDATQEDAVYWEGKIDRYRQDKTMLGKIADDLSPYENQLEINY